MGDQANGFSSVGANRRLAAATAALLWFTVTAAAAQDTPPPSCEGLQVVRSTNALALLLLPSTRLEAIIVEPTGRRLHIVGSAEPDEPEDKPEPVFLDCDAATARAILESHKIRIPGVTNSNGTATGASTPPAAAGRGIAAQAVGGPVVVGQVDRGPFTPYHAFRWTLAGGAIDLGTLDQPNNTSRSSRATGVSHDGAVVVGYSQVDAGVTEHAFRWTEGSGMVDLGAPAGASHDSRAFAVNGDGSVVVGEAMFADAAAFTGFRRGAFRWTAGGGFQNLGAIEPGFFSRANAVTADGQTIVGEGGVQVTVGTSSANGSRAFRWTSTSGLSVLGTLPGHRFATARGVSDNGAIVVGTSSSDTETAAFRWTQATGMQDLKAALVAMGADLTGIQLLTAVSVSRDGQWIAGEMRTPSTPVGETVAYLAQLCDAAVSAPCVVITPPAPSFSLAVTGNASVSVAAGQNVSTALSVTPSHGFNQAVAFSCSNLPALASCSFAPASVTPSGGAISTTLTLTTTRAITASGAVGSQQLTGLAMAGALGMLVMLFGTRRQASRRVKWTRAAAAAGVVALGSCGGDASGPDGEEQPGTPPGTYQVTVIASGGSGASAVQRTTTVTLVVTE